MVGHHAPKKYPRSSDELLGKKDQPKPFTKEQWAQTISAILASSGEEPSRAALTT